MLRTENLTFSYPRTEQTFKFPNIECQSQETLLILGDSGCGKTTFLHILAGLLKPQQGSIWIKEINIVSLKETEMDKFRGQNIGIVFQNHHFMASLTVLDNLLLTQHLAQKKPNKQTIKDLLGQMQMEYKINSYPNQLSQGEQQRVGIARALLNSPSIVLADEPTSGLDDTNCSKVIQLLQAQTQEKNIGLVIVTHDKRLQTEKNLTKINL